MNIFKFKYYQTVNIYHWLKIARVKKNRSTWPLGGEWNLIENRPPGGGTTYENTGWCPSSESRSVGANRSKNYGLYVPDANHGAGIFTYKTGS